MKGKYKSDIRVFKKLGKCQNYFLGSSFKCVWAGMHFSIVLSEIDKPKKICEKMDTVSDCEARLSFLCC